MDTMKIESRFMKCVIGRLLSRILEKKTGVLCDICLNEFSIVQDAGGVERGLNKYTIHFNVDVGIDDTNIDQFRLKCGLY